MTPDELRELADALEPMARAPRFEDFDVPAFCAWVRACADAKPVGYATANGLRMLKQDDATVLLYAHDYLIRPDHVALYTHPAPQPQPKKCGCRSCLTPAELLCTFVVCPTCGNKRCPRADDHRNACSNSNAPGQVPQPERQPVSEPRPCTCHPDDNPPIPCAQKYALSECRPEPTEAQIEAGAKWLDHHLPPEIPACSNRTALAAGVLRAALAARESK